MSRNEMVNAILGQTETLTEKIFDVYATVEEKGTFLTQRRTKVIGAVKARSIQEARQEVKRLYADLSGAYPEARCE